MIKMKQLFKNQVEKRVLRFNHATQHKEAVEYFKNMYENRNHRIIVLKPTPDLILIDFFEQKVYGVEIAVSPQLHTKKRKYHKSEFDGFIYVPIKKHLPLQPRIILK